MNSNTTLRLLAMCTALALSLYAADAHAASGSFEQTLSIDEPILLDVSTGSGTIKISTGESDQVEVTGHITVRGSSFFGIFKRSSEDMQEMVRQFESEPPVSLSDGRLNVGHLKGRAYRHNVSVSYEIVVPANTEVKSHTGSGSQTISGVAGPVEAGTGSGKVTLTDIGGAVTARSGSGSIRADDIAGAFDARAGSGSIHLTQVAPGDVVVTTGSGKSVLHGVVGALRVRAGSGRIEVGGQQMGNWDLDAGSGSIKVTLPEDAAFDLDAHTGSGGITLSHPVTVEGKISKKRIKGEVRGGGDLLRIETGSGGIRIE